jgi:hypothetical protein
LFASIVHHARRRSKVAAKLARQVTIGTYGSSVGMMPRDGRYA